MLSDAAVTVTGAGSGIGRAITVALTAAGARVVACDARAGVEETVRAASAVGHAPVAVIADVRDEQAMEALARRCLERWGRIDALVACAGILRAPGTSPKPLAELEPWEWDAVVETNLTGVFLADRAVLPAMIAARSGQIINVASVAAREARALDAAYCASKAGVLGLTEALALEVERYGIRVTALLPDAVDTPLWEQNGPLRAPRDSLPAERLAEAVVYLLELQAGVTFVAPVIGPLRARRGAFVGTSRSAKEVSS